MSESWRDDFFLYWQHNNGAAAAAAEKSKGFTIFLPFYGFAGCCVGVNGKNKESEREMRI